MIPIILALGLALMLLERRFPAVPLPVVPGWWRRVIAINAAQLAIVLLAGSTWDVWLQRASVLRLQELMPGQSRVAAAFAAYVAITFVYYWWHRFRHEAHPLWVGLHQLHHSASRIETITSFYKHPLEILCNSLLISTITYAILGLDTEAAAIVTLLTAVAEFFYHMNVKTPRWVGYFLQRPEMHRVHHQRGRHYHNFADLPVWDMLFGTYLNPRVVTKPCGFVPEREQRFGAMLRLVDVNPPRGREPAPQDGRSRRRRVLAAALVALGMLQPLGFLAGSLPVRGLGLATAASPLPLVFTEFRGIEPFVAEFGVEAELAGGGHTSVAITPATYARLGGPYNRRNVYGAVIAAGPKLESPAERALWASVLRHGFCRRGPLAREFGLTDEVRAATVVVRSKTRGRENDVWRLPLECAQ